MTPYEELLEIAVNEGVTVIDYDLDKETMGLYCDGFILIDKSANPEEKYCTLAEELGHYFTACENIVETDSIEKCKQEQRGRRWGYEKILPLETIIDAVIDGYDNIALLTERLDVTPEYLQDALIYYNQKHGPKLEYHDHIVVFSDGSLIVHPILDDIV